MKLIIKEYLSLLKESDELDSIIPELLLSMGHETISKPQKGPVQYGVDVASVGIDEDGIKKVFLFTIKAGNLSRNDWDGNSSQSVKNSLDQIQQVYIPTHLEDQYSDLPKKIVVAFGGNLNQNVRLHWKGYIDEKSKNGGAEFDYWGGDKLSLLMEEYIFNEHIVPQQQRSLFRKTLALIGDTDYDLRDYFKYLNEILYENELHTKKDKEILKSLRLVYLSLNIVISWSKSENNLKHALLASERTLLNLWGFLYSNNLTEKKNLIDIMSKTYQTNLMIFHEYCETVFPLIEVENGMSFNSRDFLQESLILFEQLGIFSLFGTMNHFSFTVNPTERDYNISKNIKEVIKIMINNHKGLYNPVYDEHIIDISLALLHLSSWDEIKFIDKWVNNLISHIEFAYFQGQYFPVDSNNFDDLVELNLGDAKDKKEYITTSTLIPILAQWCVQLGLIENYKYLHRVAGDIYKYTDVQIWYPDDKIENYMYRENASIESGHSHAPMEIPKNIADMAEMMKNVNNEPYMIDLKEASCVHHGVAVLFMISSRHFRMPILPHFWNIKE